MGNNIIIMNTSTIPFGKITTRLQIAPRDGEYLADNAGSFPRVTVVKPKRPRTAYNIFFRDEQKRMKSMKKDGNGATDNTAKLVSMKWEALPPSKKTLYFQLAVDDKLRYYKEKEEYDMYIEKVNKDKDESAYPVPEQFQNEIDELAPENWQIPGFVYDEDQSMAILASKLDVDSIDFLIKALK